MLNVHLKVVSMVMLSLSAGMLAQTQGCDLSPVIQLLSSLSAGQGGGGGTTTMPDDHGGQGMDDGQADDHGMDGNDGAPADVQLVATLSGAPPASGHATYRVFGSRVQLSIEVEDSTPSVNLPITINGTAAGDLVINSTGEGEIEFDTQTGEAEHTPWPAGVDTNLQAGATIQVGGLSGTLAVGP